MTGIDNISSSLEDYLEAIAGLIETNGHAHSKELAERLKVKMPSVTNALQGLAARDLIVYQPHQPVVLTPAGAEAANVIRRRHAGLRKFFEETLALPHADADATACKVEHVIDETVLARLSILAEAVATHPGGDQLRAHLQEAFQRSARAQPEEELLPLNQLPEGASGTIAHISVSLKGLKKFADLGLVPGSTLTMEGRAPFGDLLRVRVLGSVLSLRGSDAAYILLKKVRKGYFS